MIRFLFSGTVLVILALLFVAWLAFGTGGVVAVVVAAFLLRGAV